MVFIVEEASLFLKLSECLSKITNHWWPLPLFSSFNSLQTWWPTVQTGYTSHCCPVRTTFFYILLCQHVWVVGLDYNEPPLTQTDTTSSCSRDSHREWSLGADIGQIQLKVLCWGFVQLSVSPLWPGGSNTSGLSWLDVEVSRLCEVPSRQSSESIATWKDWLSGRWGVVLVGKFSTLTFSSGSLGRWAVWPGLSPQEESPHPPQLLLSGSYLQLWPHWRGTSEVRLMTSHFFLVLPTGGCEVSHPTLPSPDGEPTWNWARLLLTTSEELHLLWCWRFATGIIVLFF